MRNLLSALLIALCFGANAQSLTGVKSSRTAQHVNIAGTRAFVVPPAGFTKSTSFTGLQKSDKATIQIMDLVGGNFDKNTATFNREKFEGKGVKVLELTEFKVNEYPAKYAVIQSPKNPELTSINLVFGDNTFSTMVLCQYGTSDEKTKAEIMQVLKSIYYDKETKVDPLVVAPFVLDDSKSAFKFSTASAGMYIYAKGGSENISSGQEPFILVMSTPKGAGDTKKIAEMQVASLSGKGFVQKSAVSSSADKVNGYNAYETVISGSMHEKDCLLYQMVVEGKDKMISLQGVINSNLQADVEEARKLARTVKVK